NQSAVTIRVSQGEREMAAQNKMLGQFELEGIAPAQRGTPQIDVTFDIDANGIVQVSAKDKATNKEHQIRIQASGGLSEEEIQNMVNEAEANAEADKARRELIEAKNQGDGMLHATEKSLTEHGDKISAEDKTAVESDMAALKEALLTEDLEDIKAKIQALTMSSMKIGEAIYKATQEAGAAPTDAGQGEEILEADVVNKDDDRKHG
ncbi:MAG: Hsp70 family protein, partial [Alphaproteobacteria bacterium]|nr:Hsp70 family protein [Alphaproteobacteria bacterium]